MIEVKKHKYVHTTHICMHRRLSRWRDSDPFPTTRRDRHPITMDREWHRGETDNWLPLWELYFGGWGQDKCLTVLWRGLCSGCTVESTRRHGLQLYWNCQKALPNYWCKWKVRGEWRFNLWCSTYNLIESSVSPPPPSHFSDWGHRWSSNVTWRDYRGGGRHWGTGGHHYHYSPWRTYHGCYTSTGQKCSLELSCFSNLKLQINTQCLGDKVESLYYGSCPWCRVYIRTGLNKCACI